MAVKSSESFDFTNGKTVRKRRRRLIVALVLVLVSMVSWWHWPRGDARFVGKWRAEVDLRGIGGFSGWHPKERLIVFFANGRGQRIGDGRVYEEFKWRLQDDEMQIQECDLPNGVLDKIGDFVHWQFGGRRFDPNGFYVDRFDVVIHDRNRLTLRRADDPPTAFTRALPETLSRIPE